MATRSRSRARAARVAGSPPVDLRQRILETSRALLDEEGLAALSLREVARRAGVTHQAPYHHFADREAILAELVTEGFDTLAGRLTAANDRATSEGLRSALLASFEAYVGFALAHPGVFRIMFRPEVCDPQRFAQARAAGERAHAELARLVTILNAGAHDEVLASLLWAHVHGLACLLLDGPLGPSLASEVARAAHMRAVAERFAKLLLRA